MQEFPTKPDWFSITDCITTIILESFFNLFYLSTLAIGPAMHFRPILLLHWPPPCAHRSDTTECTPMPEQCWPSPELGPTDPCPPAQHREAVIAKRCFLPCLWWLDLGQHVFDLWVLVLEEEGWKGSQYFVTFIFYLFQMLTSSISERSLREVLINEPDWEDGRCVTRVYNTAIKWSSEPQCVRVSASATSWEWRSIGSSSDF